MKPWVASQKNGHLRPFFRARNTWSTVNKPARLELTGLHISANVVNESIRISNLIDVQEDISVNSWRRAVFHSILEFKTAVDALLPENSSQLISNFPLDKIVDTYEPSAIHLQNDNRSLLDPLRDHLKSLLFMPNEGRHQLFSSTGIIQERVDQWFNLDQLVLGKMAAALSLSNALIVGEGYFKRLQYDSSSGQQRNLWILRNRMVVLSNAVAILKSFGIKADLYIFPADMVRTVIFYFTILRPLACIILQLIHKEIPSYGISIWAHYNSHSRRSSNKNLPINWLWSGEEISHCLRVLTFKYMGVALTPSITHAITKSIFQKAFASLFEISQENSIVDDQAQHLTSTSIVHYGHLCHFPPFTNIRSDQPVKFLAVEQIWQAFIGLGPINEAWHSLSIHSGLFPSFNDDNLYLEVARGAVNRFYGLGSGLSDYKSCAQALLNDAPFMRGLKVPIFLHL